MAYGGVHLLHLLVLGLLASDFHGTLLQLLVGYDLTVSGSDGLLASGFNGILK